MRITCESHVITYVSHVILVCSHVIHMWFNSISLIKNHKIYKFRTRVTIFQMISSEAHQTGWWKQMPEVDENRNANESRNFRQPWFLFDWDVQNFQYESNSG